MRAAAVASLAVAGAILGVAAERQAYAWSDLRLWLPDILAGWTLLGLGIALVALRRPRGAAVLLLLAGLFWFAFDFAAVRPTTIGDALADTAYLHRGPLLALALAMPAGRPRSRLAVAGGALAWTAAIVWPLWDDDVTALLLVCTFLALASAIRLRTTGRRGQSLATRGLVAVALLTSVIAADAIRSLADASQGVTDTTILVYALAVAGAGAVLFSGALRDAPEALAERAVALERGGTRLRDALRELLGDPTLEVGFDGVDDVGRPLAAQGPGRVATPVQLGGHEVAVVLHEPGTLADAATRSAVTAAVALAAERARLQAEVVRRSDAVEESRRRLLRAEEDERGRLAARIDRGPGALLSRVDALVREARTRPGEGALTEALDRSRDQLVRIQPELDALMLGLGAVGETGLRQALERLAAGAPVPVELDAADVDVEPHVASALWFVCAECVANAVKHAEASSIRVTLAPEPGHVRLTVDDDGRGGAALDGSGLVGIADRIAALDGTLAVDSPAGRGTHVTAVLPAQPTRRQVPG